jgi:hypothetical protein
MGECDTVNPSISRTNPATILMTAKRSGRPGRDRVCAALLYFSQSEEIEPLFS